MNHLKLISTALSVAFLAACLADPEAAPPKPPAEPAKIKISVSPRAVAAGGEATVSVQLTPIDGVKINKYPKIKLRVAEQAGLVLAGEASVGNPKPPPPDQLDKNYFKKVEPVELTLTLDDSAAAGKHEIEGKLSYAYCVIASGFCAPVRLAVSIPVEVR